MSRKNWKRLKGTLGTIFVDLGKLSFGSLILGSVLRGGMDPSQVFIVGAIASFITFTIGVVIVAKR